jgi:hypothetical protein
MVGADIDVTYGDTIVVWFSCGAASAVAAKKTVELYGGTCNVRVVNNPVSEEDEDNRRFLRDVERWVGLPIETAVNSKYPSCSAVDVWEDRKFMSGVSGAPCTVELKKRARQEWQNHNMFDWMVLGFTADEEKRAERFVSFEDDRLLPVLVLQGVTKTMCMEIVAQAGIQLPRIYHLGYPNANCIGCVKATSPTYWNHVRKTHPDVFKERAEQSRKLGAKLVRVRGERIFLDELDPNEKGRSLKSMQMPDCGIFCEEKE